MDPIITQGEHSVVYATFTFADTATKAIDLKGKKVVGVALASTGTIGSVTTFDIYPTGLSVASSGTTIGSLAVNKVFYTSSYPRLGLATIKFNAAYSGDVTLLLE